MESSDLRAPPAQAGIDKMSNANSADIERTMTSNFEAKECPRINASVHHLSGGQAALDLTITPEADV